jgi:hypothetical protein
MTLIEVTPRIIPSIEGVTSCLSLLSERTASGPRSGVSSASESASIARLSPSAESPVAIRAQNRAASSEILSESVLC